MITDVLSTLTGTKVGDISRVIKQGWQGSKPFMTGCLINTNNAYSICDGLVVDVGIDDKNNLYSVSVEYEYALWVRFCQLKSCSVSFGDRITKGTKIGEVGRQPLRFEYCTDEVSDFTLRISDRLLYKHDPMPVLNGDVKLPAVVEE